jgi:hypothetical protein
LTGHAKEAFLSVKRLLREICWAIRFQHGRSVRLFTADHFDLAHYRLEFHSSAPKSWAANVAHGLSTMVSRFGWQKVVDVGVWCNGARTTDILARLEPSDENFLDRAAVTDLGAIRVASNVNQFEATAMPWFTTSNGSSKETLRRVVV